MLKNATFKTKFETLKLWMPSIISEVKKDLRNEHLKADHRFVKRYFAGKAPNKLTLDDLVQAYSAEIAAGAESLGEYVSNRWLMKNTDIYSFFETHLSQITDDFDSLEQIESVKAKEMIDGACTEFGAGRAYIFSILNSVVFSEESYRSLAAKAHKELETAAVEEAKVDEVATMEAMKSSHEREIARLTDKYEKKLSGMQRKYDNDIASLKKQLSNVQRKASEQCARV